ncbi:MAG: hypothetical protein ACLQNE_13955 [Thermoguttaceae bacterium]
MSRQLGCFFLLALSLALDGCGGSAATPQAKRYPVSGTVTLDGQPMAEGMIFFKTVSAGSLDTVDIKDGKFKGQVQEGDRRVEICQYKTETQDTGGVKTEVKKNLIPKQYNDKSKLTAKVTTQGPNEFTFAVTSK